MKTVVEILSLMSFYDVYTGICQGTCKPFFVAGNQVGLIRPDVMKHLQRFPEVCSTVLRGHHCFTSSQ